MSKDDESETMGEYWRGVKPFLKERSQTKRASNRESSAKMLVEAGIPFESKNGGAHLIVAGKYDFYPGTGLWIARGDSYRHRGVRSLISCVSKRMHEGKL